MRILVHDEKIENVQKSDEKCPDRLENLHKMISGMFAPTFLSHLITMNLECGPECRPSGQHGNTHMVGTVINSVENVKMLS